MHSSINIRFRECSLLSKALDTSKLATGSFLSIQNGKLQLIAYASKGLPKAARNYSITKLEMCGLAINIASFAHLLKR